MKKILMRPTAALFPAVLLISALAEKGPCTPRLFLYWLLMQLLSLCSVESFRNAAAREPGVRRVDRRFSGTWPVILLGFGLLLAAMRWGFGVNPLDANAVALPLTVLGITVEQLFEERMFALSRRTDGVVLSVVSSLLLMAGLLMDFSGGVAAPVQGFYAACGAGLGAVISIIANYVIEPMHAFSLVPRNIAFSPKAMVQCLLYPATAYFWMARGNGEDVLAGMILWRLSRTVCRRAQDESRSLNLLLVTSAAAMVIANLMVPGLEKYANAAIIALLCAILVFCTPSWRLGVGTVLVLAAYEMLWNPILPDMWSMIAKIAACALAVILNMHKAFLRKV